MADVGGPPAAPSSGTQLDHLPDELLVQVFGWLASVGTVWEEDDPLQLSTLPYRQSDMELMPSTGLRGYPFLAQVCRKWRRLLDTPMAQALVWRRVTVDLGHELVTSIHTPLRWSNQRPTTAEYHAAFEATSLSASKVVGFLGRVAPHARALTLSNSEGFDGDEGEYISLADKHNFGASHFGFALALMRNTLTELQLYRCHDLVTADCGVWTLVAQLPGLRLLAVEGLRGPLLASQVAPLGELSQLEGLALTGEGYRNGDWAVGLQGLPPAWSRLTSLTRLELRGHQQLPELPPWLAGLPRLAHLDVSGCCALALGPLPGLTRLEVLVLQNLCMGHELPPPAEAAAAEAAGRQPVRRAVPDLLPLAPRLRSLSLSCNGFAQLPAWLPKLTRLEHLDLSYNKDLHIRAPLTPLTALQQLRLVDFRRVHVAPKDKGAYWCEAKCTTMQHLSKLAKALKRRNPPPRVLLDV
ncbi:hypothetical protein HYH03_009291 [Edaphochlamys debaryana]|uniref:F-box domain-containing protein n=1 Tax=Edaphochlamys debaryana TaxID=47281 RepID=A0A836BXV5_9CHLO|nr:hypothetical protein HYH03_009291 [Edaphochlamys debaryana]|eukprot:KAG2492342.1 hypothetical protein HYH03_009291 [Edaphochlamys debaryana]